MDLNEGFENIYELINELNENNKVLKEGIITLLNNYEEKKKNEKELNKITNKINKLELDKLKIELALDKLYNEYSLIKESIYTEHEKSVCKIKEDILKTILN